MSSTGKKPLSVLRQSSYNSLYLNPLNELRHTRNSSDGDVVRRTTLRHQLSSKDPNLKENVSPSLNPTLRHQLSSKDPSLAPPPRSTDKENVAPMNPNIKTDQLSDSENIPPLPLSPSPLGDKTQVVKSSPSPLHLCIRLNEPDSRIGYKIFEPLDHSDNLSGANVWDHSDSEAAPASSWSTLPNRYLLCRPLPTDIGRCTCVIVKEDLVKGLDGGSLYSLYTNEGHGRQDRKLALAHHRRRNGRSEFTVAQSEKGLLCGSDASILGTITANFMGSKYHIWDQGSILGPLKQQSKLLLAVVGFVPTITTCTGSYRSLRAWIPKHQSMQLKNTTKIQHINGLPKDWETKMNNKTQQLFSRVPDYNNFSKQYELDFRERGRAGLRIQSSVKNFQLTVEENGRHSILQLGRVGKSKYVMDYRYPLTGYQAFCICLASIDSKLCCTV